MGIRVFFVDDYQIVRDGLRLRFERAGDFEFVGEAGTVADAVRLVDEQTPDVVVIDLKLPDGSGLDAVRAIRERHPDVGIVVLTMYPADEHLFGALEAGASAFVTKDVPADEVVQEARHAASNPHSFSASNLAEAIHRRDNPPGPRLTPRELEVLHLLAGGLGAAGVGDALFMSSATAKQHISAIYKKLGAANRAQAVMLAVRLGLL